VKVPLTDVKQGLRKVAPVPKQVTQVNKPQPKNSVKDLISIWEKAQFKD
jgi:hypothetical protein